MRSSWVTLDQGLSSLSNFLIVAVVGRWLGPSALGSLTILLAAWLIAYGVFKALIEDPFAVYWRTEHGEPRAVVAAAVGVGLAGAVGFGLTAAGLTLLGESIARPLLVLAVSLPCLLVQDLWRRLAFLLHRPRAAALNDLVYLVVELAAIVGFRSGHAFTLSTAVASWGIGAFVGTGLGIFQFRPGLGTANQGLAVLAFGRGLYTWLVLDFVANRMARQAALFIIAAVAGRAVLGGVQASSNVLGFTNVLALGASSAALADGVGTLRTAGTRAMHRSVASVVAFMTVGIGICAAVYGIAGRSILHAIYGPRFDAYAVLAPIIAFQVFVSCLETLPVTELRLLQATRGMFLTRLAITPVGLAAVIPACRYFGAVGAAIGLTIVAACLSLGAWIALWRVRRRGTTLGSAHGRALVHQSRLRWSGSSRRRVRQAVAYAGIGLTSAWAGLEVPSTAHLVMVSALALLLLALVVYSQRRRSLAEAAMVALVVSAGTIDLARRVNISGLSGGAALTIASVAALTLCWLVSREDRLRPAHGTVRPMACFLGWTLLTFAQHHPTVAGVQNLLVWIAFLLAIIVGCVTTTSYRAFGVTMLGQALCCAAWLAYVLYSGSLILGGLGGNAVISPRPFALFALVPIAWGVANRRGPAIQGLLLAAVGTVLIFLSLSRLAMVIALAIWCVGILEPRSLGGWVRFAAASLLGVVVMGVFITRDARVHDRFTHGELIYIRTGVAGDVPLNLEGRLELWRSTWDEFTKSPLIGNGAGAADALITRLYGKQAGHPHNDYLRLLDDYGVVGLAFWLFAYGSLLRRTGRGWMRRVDGRPEETSLHQAASIALVALGLMMITDNAMIYSFVMLPIGALVGASFGVTGLARVPKRSTVAMTSVSLRAELASRS